MLLISSSMFTVLPTPAPPKRPILPPLENGQMRSITLMPVSRSSAEGDSSSSLGAIWWIERFLSDLIGPKSSMGRPSTFMMRPSVPVPTGTEIGPPGAVTFMPRRRPAGPGAGGVGGGAAGGGHLHAAAQAVRGAERDAAHHAIAQLLLDLESELPFDQLVVRILDEQQRVVNAGHGVAVELDVGNHADALDDGALCLCHMGSLLCPLDGGCAADDF